MTYLGFYYFKQQHYLFYKYTNDIKVFIVSVFLNVQFRLTQWRYNKKSMKIPKGGNQNPYIEEQTTQPPNEKGQKDKQRSTKHTHKTKDRVTRTPLETCLEHILTTINQCNI